MSKLFRKQSTGDRLPIVDFLLAGVFVVVFAIAAGSVHEAVFGVSRTVNTPEHTLIVEILDCSSDGRFSEALATDIQRLSDSELEIEVVSRERLRLNQKLTSFVISRDEDRTLAEELAARLGLNPADVVIRPLEQNERQLQASIVLGDDYDISRLKKTPNKES